LKSLVKERVENFTISASSLYKWLEDINQFFIQYICKVPDLPEIPLTYGTYVHEILKEITSQKPVNTSIDKISAIADSLYMKYKERFHYSHVNFIKGHAKNIVHEYLKNNALPIPNSEFEQYLTAKLDDGTTISGQLDRIEISENTVLIIDYKTGISDPKPLKPFISEDDPGDGYWRQAVIYNYITKQNYPGKKEYKVEFHYVEQGKCISYKNENVNNFLNWIVNIRLNYYNLILNFLK